MSLTLQPPSADRQLCLNCWVVGDETSRVFPVELPITKNIGHLKDAIKAKKKPAFDHIPADALELWKVSVHCFDASRSAPEHWQVDVLAEDSAIRNISLDGVKPLPSVKRLSGLFEQDPIDEHVHIVIGRPPNGVFRLSPSRILRYSELSITALSYQPQPVDRQLCLNCWVLGDETSRVFTVEIASTKNVSTLKKAIKEEKKPAFDHIPADAIDLWNVSFSIAVDRNLEEHLVGVDIEHQEPLSPVAKLSEVFPGSLVGKNLHVVIQAASGNNGKNLVFPD
jgi:hypothetical protein